MGSRLLAHDLREHHMNTSSHLVRSRGFTLVEVLVSLVVLSVGLLGMAKLVLVSSHANDSAYMRSQASALAYDILDRMRANQAGALAGNYTTALNAMPSAPTSCIGTGTACTPAQLASWDVYNWKQRMTTASNLPGVFSGALPSGTASIATSAISPVTATIVVQWDDSAAQTAFGAVATGTAAPMSVTLETVLQ
jgi:type IV pilus assembly protein PilV